MSKPNKPAKAPDLPKRNPDSLTVKIEREEDIEPAMAALAVSPLYNATLTTRGFSAALTTRGLNATMDALMAELGAQAEAVNGGNLARGEAMLTAQAHTLDGIFNVCARRALANAGEYLNAAETFYRVGLRAQSQCRATWETLAQMKNPAPVAFVRQANIANGPQQVNNGPAPARETEAAPSKQSGGEHVLLPDARASGQGIGADSPRQAVGEVHRAAHAGGEGEGGA